MDKLRLAIIRSTEADAAEIRYRVAVKLQTLVVANRITGRSDTWIVRVA